jgi:hypothetical protein
MMYSIPIGLSCIICVDLARDGWRSTALLPATGIVEEDEESGEPGGAGNRPGGCCTVFHELFQGRPGDGSARR